MKSYKTIFVNPVERISYQGRHNQMYVIDGSNGEVIPTTRMGKTKEDGVSSTYVFPQHGADSNRIYTGLDKPIANPFRNMTAEEILSMYNLGEEWSTYIEKIIKQSTITKQTYYEIKHGKKPGDYTSAKTNSDGSKSYLSGLKLILYPRPNRFTDEVPENELKIELIKLHNKIANSKGESNSTYHDWYISQENEAELEASNKRGIVKKATAQLYKLQTEYPRYKNYQMLITMTDQRGEPIAKGDLSDIRVDEVLDFYIQDSNSNQIDNIAKFTEKFDLLQTNEGLEKFTVEYLVKQAINSNVFSTRDGYIVWHSKAGTPGVDKWSDYNKLVSFFVKEFKTYSPKEKDITNWYKDLYAEVKSKGIWLE